MGKGFVTFQRKLRGDTTPYRVVSGNHPVITDEEGFRHLMRLEWGSGDYITDLGVDTEDVLWAFDSFNWERSGLTEEQQNELIRFMDEEGPIPEFIPALLDRWGEMGSDNWEYT